MARSNRIPAAVALLAIDSSQIQPDIETVARRKARFLTEATDCGFHIYRSEMWDVVDFEADHGDGPLEISRAGEIANKRRLPLILDFSVDHPILQKMRVDWVAQGIEIIDREALTRHRDAFRSRNIGSAPSDVANQKVDGETGSGKKKAGSPRDTSQAVKAAAANHRMESKIRHRQYAVFFDQARAEGAVSSSQIADWLNARGVRTAEGRLWNRQNVRRVLAAIEWDNFLASLPQFAGTGDDALVDNLEDIEWTEEQLAEMERLRIADLEEESIGQPQREDPQAPVSRVERAESLLDKADVEIIDDEPTPGNPEPDDIGAGVAQTHDLVVVTRNAKHFLPFGFGDHQPTRKTSPLPASR